MGTVKDQISEAIVAAFLRFGSDPPLLYSFADYLLIELSAGAAIRICSNPHGADIALASDPEDVTVWKDAIYGELKCDQGSFFILVRTFFDGASSNSKSASVVDEAVAALSTLQADGTPLSVALYLAYRRIVDSVVLREREVHTSFGTCRSCLTTDPSYNENSEVLESVSTKLGEVFERQRTEFAVHAKRCLSSDPGSWSMVSIYSPPGIDPESLRVLQTVRRCCVQSGLVQKYQSNGAVYMIVPLHYGGVPWLTVTTKFTSPPEPETDYAYIVYRDLLGRLSDQVRQVASDVMIETMAKLLEQRAMSTEDSLQTPIAEVNRAWAIIPCLFPVRRPMLRPWQAANDDVDHQFRIWDEPYVVDFTMELSPAFASEAYLFSELSQSWGMIGTSELRKGLSPTLQLLQELYHKRREKIGLARYAVGHPLKHRLRQLGRFIDGAREQCSRRVGSDIIAAKWFHGMEGHQKECYRVAELLNFLSVMSRGLSGSKKSEDIYLVPDPYPLWSKIIAARDQLSLAPPNEFGELSLTAEGEQIDALTITGFVSTGSKGLCRYFDTLYDEILYELLLNVMRHGSPSQPLHIKGDRTMNAERGYSEIVLTFSNRALNTNIFQSLNVVAGTWVDAGRYVGGLGFLYDVLQLSHAGALQVSVSNADRGPVFNIRLALRSGQ